MDDHTDFLSKKLKANKYVTILVLISVITGGIAAFLTSLTTITDFFSDFFGSERSIQVTPLYSLNPVNYKAKIDVSIDNLGEIPVSIKSMEVVSKWRGIINMGQVSQSESDEFIWVVPVEVSSDSKEIPAGLSQNYAVSLDCSDMETRLFSGPPNSPGVKFIGVFIKVVSSVGTIYEERWDVDSYSQNFPSLIQCQKSW